MKYLIALSLAALIIVAGAWFCLSTRSMLNTQIDTARQNSDFPNQETAEGFRLELSSSLMRRMALADLLANFAVILIPLTLAACLGAAHFTGRDQPANSKSNLPIDSNSDPPVESK